MNPDFSGPEGNLNLFSSKEAFIAKQFAKRYIESGKIDVESLNSDEKIEEAILLKGVIKDDSTSIKDVIKALRDMGAVKPVEVVVPEKKKKEKIESEFIPVNIKNKYKVIEDPTLKEMYSSNIEAEQIKEEKQSIFDDAEEVDILYSQILELDKTRSLENDDYYNEFVQKGLVKKVQVLKDLRDLREAEKGIELDRTEDSRKFKKIGTVAEIGLEYVVTQLQLFGENIKVDPACKVDDILHKVDGILEILRKNKESNFMGLGIDVTFGGLDSQHYKDKIFSLLRSIKKNKKTHVKYFKRHDGKLMNELVVPKIVLHLDFSDVKNLAYLLKNSSDEKAKESFKKSNFKYEIMNQIINSSKRLSRFAKECGNDISESYDATIASLEELSGENDVISKTFATVYKDKISQSLDKLILEFKMIEEAKDRLKDKTYEEVA